MFENIFIWILILGYIIFGVLVVKLLKNILPTQKGIISLIIISFFYALIFGIGIVGGSEAEPGFALPSPILLALLFDILLATKIKFMVNGILIPFLFWWLVIFLIMAGTKIIYPKVKSYIRNK